MRKRERKGGRGHQRRSRRRRRSMAGRAELAGDALKHATRLGFPIQKLPEREEGEGKASPASEWPKNFPCKASDGAAMEGTFGARGSDPREHRNAREKAEVVEEDEARSPTRRMRTKTARTAGFTRRSRRRFTGVFGEFLRAQGESRAGERAENGEKRGGSHAGALQTTEAQGGKRGSWARGLRPGRFPTERGRSGGGGWGRES